MKQMFYSVIALLVVCCYSCSNHELEDFQGTDIPKNDVAILSRSAGKIDYSQYTLLENRTIMPRTGESYQGTVVYKDTAFPVYIYWDLEFENYNLFAYINGINLAGYLVWVGDIMDGNSGGYYEKYYQLSHVSSEESGSNTSRFDFIIKCNFSEYASNGYHPGTWTNYRHVAFHVTFYPITRNCSYEIIEDGEGFWRELEID